MTEANGINGANGVKKANGAHADAKTDHTRWRLRDIAGAQTWHYLETDEEVKAWPQTIPDKYHLGMETVRSPLELPAYITNTT